MVKKQWVSASLVVLFMLLATVQPEAQNRRRRGRIVYRPAVSVAFVGGYGPRYYRGGGYYIPAYRDGGHYGTVDFNITPRQSLVYVDGALIGRASDFDGGVFGSTARLSSGTHEIRILAPNGSEIKRRILVMPGRELNFNFRF